MLKIIVEEEDKGVALLRRLSRFSRNRKPEFAQADINAIIEDAINLTWPLVRYSKMTIERVLGPDIPLITVVKDQIQDVFVAMILNAFDATIEKGTLSIKTNYNKEENIVEILLSDTGTSIKQKYLKQIEEASFMTKAHEKRVEMGLAISQEIISSHKGSLRSKSTIGGGTTFSIHLPVDKSIQA